MIEDGFFLWSTHGQGPRVLRKGASSPSWGRMQKERVSPESSWRDTELRVWWWDFLNSMFQLGKAKLRNSFQLIRKHTPQRVILRLHFKFCPQYDPYTSAAGSSHLPKDANIYSGTATFSLEQLATTFCNCPSPFASTYETGRQRTFALQSTFGYLGGRYDQCVTYSAEGAKSLQHIKWLGIIHVVTGTAIAPWLLAFDPRVWTMVTSKGSWHFARMCLRYLIWVSKKLILVQYGHLSKSYQGLSRCPLTYRLSIITGHPQTHQVYQGCITKSGN